MSKSELTYTLKAEISKMNKMIDHKILRGLPYSKEAHYHKKLLNRLSIIRQKSFLARSMRSFAMMMF